MHKKFKHLFVANAINIGLWVAFIVFIITLFVLALTTTLDYSINGEIIYSDATAIFALFICVILIGVCCGILNTAIAIIILVFYNDVGPRHKNFLLICGILMFFFTFTINCVVHNRLKRLSNPNEYQQLSEPINNTYSNDTNYSYQYNQNQIQQTPTTFSACAIIIDKISELFSLKEKGAITSEEFTKIKDYLISRAN